MFDILYIFKYEECMEELRELFDTGSDLSPIGELEEEKELSLTELGAEFCTNISVDEYNNDVHCRRHITDTTNLLCSIHSEEYKSWLNLILIYVQNVLGTVDKKDLLRVTKEHGKGWKQELSAELDISSYKLNKLIRELRLKDNLDETQIVKYIDDLP